MKAVMMSIQPKWCEKIASGEKTIEVRKTKPKCETPFKCYIYETKHKEKFRYAISYEQVIVDCNKGRVIGEFTCDKIDKYEYLFPFESEDFQHAVPQGDLQKICLEDYELDEYLGDRAGYGWHISELKLYDKPKELYVFRQYSECLHFADYNLEKCCACKKALFDECGAYCGCDTELTKAPQSWCYVEEKE